MDNRISQLPAHLIKAIDDVIAHHYRLDLERIAHDKVKPPARCFTVKEAEGYSGVSRYTLARAAKAGKLQVYKLSNAKSGKVLIEKASLDLWLDSCRQFPAGAR